MPLEQSINPHLTTAATITRMVGQVSVIDQQGHSRELEVGDQVQPGEKILSNANSGILLLLPDGNMLPVGNVPVVLSGIDEAVADLDELPVKAPLTRGEGDDLIAKTDADDRSDESKKHLPDDEKPVSSSVTEGVTIEMDLSQVSPDINASTANPAGMDFSEYSNNTIAGSHSTSSSASTGATQTPAFINFSPVITGDSSGSAQEDLHLTSTGALQITDQNSGDIASVDLSNGKGAYGTLAIDQQGHWAYQLDNTNPQVQALGAGEQITEKFSITVTDKLGASVQQQITITVDGTNDRPVISGVHTGDITEGSTQEVKGVLTQTDVDTKDTHHWSVVPGSAAQHGVFSIDQNGQWHYTLDNTDKAVSTLAQGQQLTDVITVKVSDNHGGETTQQVIVTINGENAAPVIGGVFSGSVIEDKITSISEQLSVTDTDTTDSHTFAVSNPQGSYGRLSVDANTGMWTYNLNHAKTDALVAGEHQQETFSVTVTDNFGGSSRHLITVDIAGSNDKPVINTIAAQHVDEGGAVVSGQITSSDVDHGATVSYSTPYSHGGFTLDKNGHYQLDPTDKSFDHLAAGEKLLLTVPIIATDNNGGSSVSQDLVITVTGTNDRPVISNIAAQSVNEGEPVFQGKIDSTDVDHGDTATYSTSFTHAGFKLDSDGSYRIDPTDKAFNSLAAGEHTILTVPVTVTDNHGGSDIKNLVITINGTNDIPVVGTISQKSVAEGGATVHGQVGALDPDHGDTIIYSQGSPQQVAGFVLSKDGSYTFDPRNPAYDHLKSGETQTLTIPVVAVDNHGGVSAAKDLVITITGTNDKAVITSTTVSVTEDTHQSANIHLGISDSDTGEAAFRAETIPGAHGSATLTANGGLVYTLDNAAAQHLNVGESITDTITVTSKDGTTHDVSVTIHGTNDNPTINAITAQAANEDGSQVSGRLAVTDVDTGDSATYATTATPAGFLLRADGSYTLDPGNAAYQHLAVGETQVLTVPVIATDSHGGTSASQNIVITITGSNDIPVVSAPVTLAAGTEDKTQTITSAQLLANTTDVDTTDTLSVQKVTVDHGTVTTDASGTVHFTPEPDYNGKVTFSYEVTDSHGGVVAATATTDLAAVQDAAVITSTPVDVTEDVHTSAQITLSITDADAGEAKFVAGSLTGAHGAATLTEAGVLVYTLDNAAAQHLNAGESITDTITVASKDGTTHDVSVTINGTNDNPTINAITAQAANEDGSQVSGRLAVTDVDTGDTATYATTATPAGFSLKADGSYTLDPGNAAYQHLAVGETQVLTVPVVATDSHGGTSASQNIVITITGTNDIPVVSAPVVLPPGTEDKTQTITLAQLLANTTDVDTTDTLSVQKVTVDHGTVTTDASGTVHFTPEPNYNGKVTFSYEVTDSHGGVVAATATTDLAAVQDAAIITGQDAASVKEDDLKTTMTGNLEVGGQLHITDPDAGEAKFDSKFIGGQAGYNTPLGGHLILTSDGSWTYTIDNAKPNIQALNEGQSISDIVTIESVDGTKHDITITINGTNDLPVINAIVAQSAYEDGSKVTGVITATDVDTGDSSTFATTSTQAGFTLKPDGSYSLDPGHAAFQHLAAGETQVITIPVVATDGHSGASVSQNLLITVTGTNDIPTVSAPVTLPAGTEDLTQTITAAQLLANAKDVDSTDTLSVVNVKADHGIVTTDASGAIHFTPEPNYNGKVTFTYDVTDSHGGTVQTTATTDLAAVQDAAVITSAAVDVTEDSHQSASITLGITDADKGEAVFQAGNLSGAHGSATLTAAGVLVYTLDNAAAQHLNVGESISDTITVTSKDGTTHDVSVTIHGTNDNPVINAISAQAANEDGSKVTGTVSATDIDSGDQLTFSASKGLPPGMTLDSQGSYTLDPSDKAFQHLAAGETITLSVPVQVTDSHGATDTTNITIVVTGTNDIPVVSAPVVLPAGTEDLTQTITSAQLLANATDVDGSDKLSVSNVKVDHGSITIDGAGTLHYTPQPDYNGKVTFSYDVIDGHGGVASTSATTDLAAVQDTASITSTTVDVTEDTHTSVQITLGITDPDAGEAKFVAGSLTGAHGAATLTEAGVLVYTLDNAAAQHLNVGESVTDIITVTSKDGTTHDVSVTINGSNDNPVINAIAAQAANEDGSKVTGTITSTDVDTGDTASYATRSTQAGFILNRDGSYSLDPTDAAFQHLAAGETQTIKIPVSATDSHGGVSVASELVITITGTNDKPVVSAPVVLPAGTEDLTQTITASQLLANATDIDTKDVLSISGAVTADHGTVSGPDASGAYHFTPAPDYNGPVTFSYAVTDSNSGTVAATATTTLAAVDDLIVDSGARDLGATDEDKAQHISEAQLLQNLHDVDGSLSVVGTPTSAHGTVTVDPAGGFIFTPAANYHGPAELSYQVTDGTTQYSKTASLDATSVTDPAKITVAMSAEQDIITTGTGGTGRIQVDNINAASPLKAFTLEFTVVGKAVTSTGGTAGPVVVNMGSASDNNILSLWNPANMKVGGAGNVATGVDLTDGNSHRITLSWDSAGGILKVYDNGNHVIDIPNYHKGGELPADLYAVLGGKMNDPTARSGFNANEHYDGQIFNTALATKALTASEIQKGPIASQLDKSSGLLFDIRSSGGTILDSTGHLTNIALHGLTHTTVQVDTSLATPPTGSLIHLNLNVVATATDDKLTKVELTGLIKGTLLDDGNGNTHTITGMEEKVDVTSWSLSSIAAQLPAGILQNMNIGTVATTTAADGKIAVVTEQTPLVLDVNSPIPNANISGDDNKAIDEDHSVAGVLHVTDSDATQAHFDTAPVDGKYGQLTITADGHWVFTPNAVANALNEGDKVNDILSVKSADGSSHQVIINITGSNDAPVINNVVNQSAIEDGKTLSGHLVATDVDSGDQLTFSASKAGLPPGMTLDSQGNYTLDPSDKAFQHLAAGEPLTLTVPVQVTDSHGATDTTNITIVVTGSNDIPTLNVVPDTGNPQQGDLQGSDVDSTDTLSYSVVNANGQFGSLSIDPSTHQYSYTQAQSVAGMSYDKATQTYSGRDVFEVKVSDGKGGETSKFISFDVNGQVSAPTPGNPGVPVVQTGTSTAGIGNTAPPVTTAPVSASANAVSIDLLAGSDSGQSATDNITKDNTPTVSGQTDIPFSRVEIVEGGKLIASTTSDANGHYSVTTAALTDAGHNLVAQATAPSANAPVSSSPLNIVVDTQIDTGAVDITDGGGGDGIINAQEAGSAKISGRIDASASLASLEITDVSGNKVTVPAASVSVDPATGQYIANVDVSSLTDGTLTVTAIATDTAGNSASVTDSIVLDTFVPPAINPANIVFPTLGNSPTPTLTVTAPAGLPPGTQVQVTVPPATAGGTPTVATGSVPAGGGPVAITLPTLPQGTTTPSVSLVTPSGNSTAPVSGSITVDTTPPTISIDAIDTDNVINAAEHKTDLTITGKTDAEVGQEVTVNVAGTDYKGSVAAGGTFSVTVPAATVVNFTDGQHLAITAKVTDAAGNDANSASAAVAVDLNAAATITVDSVTTDNVINAAESGGKVNVTGSVSGDVKDGDTVTLTVNGKDLTGTVSGGQYSIAVDGSDLKADSNVHASVTAIDGADNTQTAATDHTYSVDTRINAGITFDNITMDNIVNTAEAGRTVTVTGTVSGDVKDGDTVTVSASGYRHTGVVSGGTFAIDVPGNELQHGRHVNATATTTDAAGNSATATAAHNYSVDLKATAGVSVDSITPDNVINAAESGGKVNVTGSVSGDVKDGDTVTLTVNGNTINGTVIGGQYSIAIDGSDLKADSNVHASVTATDNAGNTQTAAIDHSYTVDTTADAGVIFVNKVTGDDLINAQEAGSPIKIEGFSGTGDIKQGDTVTTVINGHSYTTTTTDATGLFTFHVDPADLKAQPSFVVSIDSVDTVGNHVQTTSSHSVSFDLDAAQLGISLTNDTGSSVTDHVTSDGALTITNQETGATVEYSIDGGKNWTNAFIPVDGTNTLLVRQTDAAGNTSATTSLAFTLDNNVSAPTVALQTDSGVSTSDAITNDGRLLVSNVEKGAQVEYSTDGKNWSNSFNPTEGLNHVQVRQTDTAGNVSAGSSFDFTYDTTKPVVTMAHTVDSNQAIYTISGSASADIDAIDIVLTRGTSSVSVHPQIDAQGNWSYTLPSAAGDHQYGVTVSGVDKAGNTSLISTDSFVIDSKASSPVISFESTGTDSVYNAQEVAKGGAGTITATITLPADAKAGDTLSVNGGAHILTDTDIKTGSVTQEVIPGAQLTANITDALGNISPDAVATAATADLSANASIQLDSITTDNIVNATEAGSTVSVTGSVGGDAHMGDTVTLTVGGATHTGTVDANGNFSINVPGSELQGATAVGASVTTTDAAGNTATATGTQTYSVDTRASATVMVDSITPDNVINAAESGRKVNVTGTVGGDVKDGDTVTLTVNGKDITGTVSGDKYSIAVDGADLKADSNVKASVTATDVAGNTQTATVDHAYTVDTQATGGVVVIHSIAGDNIVSAKEVGTMVEVTGAISNVSSHDFKQGDVVTTVINGHAYSTTLEPGRAFFNNEFKFSVSADDLKAQPGFSVEVTSYDNYGNEVVSVSNPATVTFDTTATASITVDSITGDDIVTAAETGGKVNVTGVVGGDVKDGDIVTLRVNGHYASGSVSGGKYSIDVDGSDLAKDSNVHASVNATDAVGNMKTATVDHAYTADTQASATDDTGDVTEDKVGVTSGNVLSNDADAASVTTTGDIAGKYGTFHFNSDGSYTYTLDNSHSAVQKLAPSSAPLLDSVSYTAVDDHGNTVTANLNINIHGVIDAPTLTTSHEAITFNPIDAIADGRGNANVDLTAFNVSGRGIENAQGHLDLSKADATMVTTSGSSIGVSDKSTIGRQHIDTNETLLIHLQGESRSAVISLGGFSSKSTSTGKYAGRSDDRMHWLAYDHNGVKVGEGNYDPKSTDVGSTSTAVITTSSPYTYLAIQALHNPDPNVGVARFTVDHVEAPLIAYETKVNFNGVLGDAKSSETLSYKVTGLDALSGFDHGTKNPDGSWTITAKDAADLRVHHVGALDLTVQAIATDGAASASSSPVNLHIDGATGAQYELISGVHSGATTEDEQKPVQGDLGIDTTAPGQHEFVTQTTTSKYGTFTLNANGHWTYQVNQAGSQSLSRGDTQQEVFKVVTNNGVSRDVTVDIKGMDDASVVGGRVGSVTEDKTGQTQISDHMTVTDIDSDVSTLAFKSVTEQGTYGDLTIQTDGTWTYTLDSAKADSLAAGEIAHESFVIPLIDTTTGRGLSKYIGPSPTTDEIEITINGTNDAAVIGGVDQASTREGDTTAVGGSLTVSDADHNQDSFIVVNNQAGDKGYGQFSVDANGQWSYKLNNNNASVRALNASDKATDSIVVHSADGTAHTISVEITGQDNQAPSLQAGSVTLDEDQLHFFKASEFGYQDADGDSLHHITIEEAPKDGFLTLDTKPVQVGQQIAAADLGRLIFIPLGNESGQSYASFKITASDGQTDSAPVVISLNVNAINDAPVVEQSSVLVDSVKEDGATDKASGHIDVTDVDGDSLSYNIDPANQPRFGTLSVDSQGQWHYQLDNTNQRLDSLDSGQSLTDYAKVQVSDGHGGMVERDISIVINGSDDNHAAVISGADSGRVTEDGKLSIAGQLDVTDQDGSAEELLQAQTQQGQYGEFKVYADGYWEYHLSNSDSAVQNLDSTDNVQDTITVKSIDGTPHVITVAIQGADESHAPVISAFSGGTSWRRPYQWTGQVDATDADRGDRLDYDLPNGRYGRGGSVTSRGSYGVLTLESNGDLTYRVNSRLNTSGMDHPHGRGNNDREGREYFEVQVTDKQGNTDTKYIEFVVHSKGDGKSGYVYSQTETDHPPRRANINDEALTDNALVAEQITIDLDDVRQQIAAATHEINVLSAQGADTTQAQAQLDQFTAIRESLNAELAALDTSAQDAFTQAATQQAQVDETGIGLEQINVDLANTDQQIIDISHEIQALAAQGADTTDAEARLEALTAHVDDLVTQEFALQDSLQTTEEVIGEHDGIDEQGIDSDTSAGHAADGDTTDAVAGEEQDQGQAQAANTADEHQDNPDSADLSALVASAEPHMDFDHVAEVTAQSSVETPGSSAIDSDSAPLNIGDVLDSVPAGEADILQAVDKLEPSRPDAVDKADTDAADSHDAPDAVVDDPSDVMPDRAALDTQLVEPPDEHQQ